MVAQVVCTYMRAAKYTKVFFVHQEVLQARAIKAGEEFRSLGAGQLFTPQVLCATYGSVPGPQIQYCGPVSWIPDSDQAF
jgi:hypothetical protein